MADARHDALLRTDAYRYDLRPELIAQTPAEPADASRLMVVGAGPPEHKRFTDFPSLLRKGDVLVINETRVVRARLHGVREPGGGAAEVFLLRPSAGGPFSFEEREWLALVKPGRRLRRGAMVRFGDDAHAAIVDVHADGERTVRFESDVPLETLLERYGTVPLPPYVGSGDRARDERYQTIFARVAGSVAAPTASLHFTPRVLDHVRDRGVEIVPLVLDVGLGTFKPMDTQCIDDHVMHAERFAIPQASVTAINAAKAEGRRVIVAGTTAMRAVEAAASDDGRVKPCTGDTDLFIRPGYRFHIADALLTNFHLPASTLLVLVTVFGGYERIMAAYQRAIAERYRFYSFGDAMFVHAGGEA
ncbi:MAG: tRNA preQ1(34) S-adenosylmethionine ribosyltransferase-isomerase QueA [Candidatus Eremiobacteraeota bacterium]|nr:tRNA preQ1(34) S-adenosylmethionine ribosyltransferase-isomerase QueA [Candidatus Eremiobacteraeota bacterium]MBC5823127.1 tRNA preQ1(34) S-adenosylmethionine ribosyltransferase-isomerase QueA [Candidatus Eremiobacteraeota bacterium]